MTGVISELRVLARTDETDRIVSLLLEGTDGPLPPVAGGAHIDLHTPSGPRQYSLSAIHAAEGRWRVSVSRDAAGRGGSSYLCDDVWPGDILRAGGPRNHLELEPARSYVFLAGGVGITPLLPLIREVASNDVPWRLEYAARDNASFAFRDELEALRDASDTTPVNYWASAEGTRVDVDAVVASVADGELLYLCGPEQMIEAALGAADHLGVTERVRFERFVASTAETLEVVAPVDFTLVCELSGVEVEVTRSECILDVLSAHGIFVPTSCASGICGTCETPVLDGEVVHRDALLSDEERSANDRMYVCVSRSASPRLVLDV